MDGRRLLRDREERVVAGVASGAALFLDIDPFLARLGFAALCIFGGAGLILYAIGWLLIPEALPEEAAPGAAPGTPGGGAPETTGGAPETPGGTQSPATPPPTAPAPRPMLLRRPVASIGVVLISLGAVALLRSLIPWVAHQPLWPLAVVALGLLLLMARH